MKSKIILKTLISICYFANIYCAEVIWNSGQALSVNNEIIGVTKGDSSPLFLSIKIEPVDFNKENFYFDINVKDILKTDGIELRFSEQKISENFFSYSIPFFDDYEFNLLQSNNYSSLAISMANLQTNGTVPNKINYLTIYFSDRNFKNTIIIKNIHTKKKLSDGFVSITFDDGYIDNYIAATETKPYGIAATAYVIPHSIGKKGYIDLFQIKELKKKYGWDIQYHHETPVTQLNLIEYYIENNYNLSYLDENKLNSKKQAKHFAYPLGRWNQDRKNRIRDFYDSARLAGGGIETLPPADNYALRAYNVLNTHTAEELFEVAKLGVKNKQWVIFMFHYINDKPKNALEFSRSEYKKFIRLLSENNILTRTMDRAWEKIPKNLK